MALPPATVLSDLLTAALQDSGAFARGMPPPADAINDALRRLNWLIGQWRRKRWLVYRLVELSINANGSQSYTVGPAGQLACDFRPAYISYAFMRQVVNAGNSGQVDHPLSIIPSREDYSKVRLKSLVTWTQAIWYDPDFPLGRVYPVPIMAAPFQLFLGAALPIDSFGLVTQSVSLPEEYEAAIYTNMVERLGDAYRVAQPESIRNRAKEALQVIRSANRAISNLQLPGMLQRRGGGRYNIFSDNN